MFQHADSPFLRCQASSSDVAIGCNSVLGHVIIHSILIRPPTRWLALCADSPDAAQSQANAGNQSACRTGVLVAICLLMAIFETTRLILHTCSPLPLPADTIHMTITQ